MKVGVLASGAGTNLQAILYHVHGREGVEVVAVGSDKSDAQALERAATSRMNKGGESMEVALEMANLFRKIGA